MKYQYSQIWGPVSCRLTGWASSPQFTCLNYLSVGSPLSTFWGEKVSTGKIRPSIKDLGAQLIRLWALSLTCVYFMPSLLPKNKEKNFLIDKFAGVNLYGYRQFLDVRRPGVDKEGNILP